mmetsp:Transcript_10456/g.27690  ORF Transcript_10456/g.27690 Transcript_10456/m.27690 type:complete len:263 (+) Transcript_10456:87-875(+)
MALYTAAWRLPCLAAALVAPLAVVAKDSAPLASSVGNFTSALATDHVEPLALAAPPNPAPVVVMESHGQPSELAAAGLLRSGTFGYQTGYIPAGHDIKIAKMSVSQAEIECRKMPACKGITYYGPQSANGIYTIYFKSVATMCSPCIPGWSTFLFHETHCSRETTMRCGFIDLCHIRGRATCVDGHCVCNAGMCASGHFCEADPTLPSSDALGEHLDSTFGHNAALASIFCIALVVAVAVAWVARSSLQRRDFPAVKEPLLA